MKNLKKILAMFFVAVLLVSLSAVAFAEDAKDDKDGNVKSVVTEIEVVGIIDAEGKDVTNKIIVTRRKDKDKLSDEKRLVMEEAIDKIIDADDVSDLNEDVKAAAAGKTTAVLDLFDLSATDDVVFPIKMTLKISNLKDFVGLMYYVDGEFVTNEAEVAEGDILKGTYEGQGVFAIAVTVDETTSPETGESVPYGFFAGALVLACAAAFFFVKSRKA